MLSIHEAFKEAQLVVTFESLKCPTKFARFPPHSRIVGHVCVSPLHLGPLPEMQRASVEYVDVPRRKEVYHGHYERTDPHENDVLADPPRVIVDNTLKHTATSTGWK